VYYTATGQSFYVSTGFYNAYESIRQALIEEIASIMPRRVIFTGHSLGGALATLAAWDVSHVFQNDVKLVTFGAPHVGCERFVRECERELGDNVARIVIARDCIPHLLTKGGVIDTCKSLLSGTVLYIYLYLFHEYTTCSYMHILT
jgi:predicted lipase